MTRRYSERLAADLAPQERIARSTTVDPVTGCWLWQRALSDYSREGSGYGQFQLRGVNIKAHRYSYEAFVGPIPDGLHIDHLCRIRRCVNPAHLEPVTCLENVRRSPITHGKEPRCPQGHDYDAVNTIWHKGRRYCRLCRDARNFLWRNSTPEERASRKAAGLPVLDVAAHFAAQEAAA